ncbi:MAG: hypothetical protein IKX20_10110, partial [Paludibacteraceae bacterium]|nr:hypothetical protein [Paludibacteraceae bacterium]
EVQREQNRVSNAIQSRLAFIIESELSGIKEKLKAKRKSLDELRWGGISFPSYSKFSSNIDFDGASDELKFSFDDFATGFGKTGSIAAAGAGRNFDLSRIWHYNRWYYWRNWRSCF